MRASRIGGRIILAGIPDGDACTLDLRRASQWRDHMGGNTITAYVAHFSLTDAGIKAAKDSPRRLDAAVLHLGALASCVRGR